jgi:DeoR family transcriptional regulator of aga operon
MGVLAAASAVGEDVIALRERNAFALEARPLSKGQGRRAAITTQLADTGEVGIAELAGDFGVSEMTIRRDLELLELEGLARRVRGGAISTVSRSHEPPFAVRQTKSASAKRTIGRVAASMLEDGDTAIIDVGTTTLELARNLHRHRRLTVVTSSIPIATELGNSTEVRVIVTGGILRHGELSLVGPTAEESLEEFNCDVAFIGVAGVDGAKGLTEYNLDDARMKRAAIASARRCIVLADRTKLGQVALAMVAPLTSVDTLVTDAPPDHPTVLAAVETGIAVVHVSSEPVTVEALA